MSHARVQFGGLRGDVIDELIGVDHATDASDCVVDYGSIYGRGGYRNAVGVGSTVRASGAPQGLWRYRHGPSGARVVTAIGGYIDTVADPASESAVGAVTAGSAKFGATDAVSAAQLGQHLYISSDNAASITYPMVRMKPDYTIEAISQLPTPVAPVSASPALTSMSLVKFSAASARTGSSGVTVTELTYGSEKYYKLWRSGPARLENGDSVTVDLTGSGQNWSGYSDIILIIAPPRPNKGGGAILVEVGSSSSVYESIGAFSDTGISGSWIGPGVAYLSLLGVSATTLGAVRYLRFTIQGSGIFTIYGYILSTRSPGVGSHTYEATYQDVATARESTLSPALEVTVPSPKSFVTCIVPSRTSSDDEFVTAAVTTDPGAIPEMLNCNAMSGLSTPSRNQFAGSPRVTVTVDSSLVTGQAVRLWRTTSKGRRLVKAQTLTMPTASVTFEDDIGDTIYGNAAYKAGGTQSRCNAMAARHGRLILGWENRLWISSYIGADTAASSPMPTFPAIAIEESDGWAFDIAPANTEQIQALVNGDALYILTNEGVYAMWQVSPNSPPYQVLRRGVVSRRGAIYAEDRLFWAAWDGIYTAQGRADAVEMTRDIRRIYQQWLIPDSTTVVAYQNRKLLIWRGTRFLRYDFVTQTWVRGTTAHSMLHAACWHDPGAVVDQCWLLTSDNKAQRWQSASTTDDGTAIPAWTYRSGYVAPGATARVKSLLMEVGGKESGATLTVSLMTCPALAPIRSFVVSADTGSAPIERMGPTDLRSYKWRVALNASSRSAHLRSLALELEAFGDARGG